MPRPYLDLRGEPSRVYVDMLEGAALSALAVAEGLSDDAMLGLKQALTNLQETDIWASRFPPEEDYDEQD